MGVWLSDLLRHAALCRVCIGDGDWQVATDLGLPATAEGVAAAEWVKAEVGAGALAAGSLLPRPGCRRQGQGRPEQGVHPERAGTSITTSPPELRQDQANASPPGRHPVRLLRRMSDQPEAAVELLGTDSPLVMRLFPTTERGVGLPAPLRVVDRTTASEEGTEMVQILEGTEYSYEIEGLQSSLPITSDVRELLIPDKAGDGRKGHLRPGNRVGLLPIQLQSGNQIIGRAALEVRSRKFDYLSHFRWMLRDIANQSIAALMQRFAPTHIRLEADASTEPVSAYQTFRLLRAVIEDPLVLGAVYLVLNRPHTEWLTETEHQPASRGLSN